MADVEERGREAEMGGGKERTPDVGRIQAKSKRMFDWVIWKFSTVFGGKQNSHSTWEYKNILWRSVNK